VKTQHGPARAKTDPARRRASLRWGLHAERVAELYLTLKFYRVLERRYGAAGGEIDLVACRGRTVVFVEVKARRDLDVAAEAIGPAKRRRILRAVSRWRATHPWAAAFSLRCDAVFVAPWRWPRHVEDAFPIGD
jgi:putative endonuclease